MNSMLDGKKIVVGVCGGIAAYKVVEVVSRLKKLNAEVDVIMTANAVNFVTPLTFQSISHNPVITDMFSQPQNWDIKHISLAEKADLIMVAPATANIIGKVANGIADDMLSTTIMASKAPVVFVPAMNHNMYENNIVQGNISRLRESGYIFLEPETGMMACGTSGKGRLPDPEVIVERILVVLNSTKDLEGVNVLITAGPTREAIDPVRYISNHSSGKMGYAIANAACQRGAKVRLVSGPVYLKKPWGVEVTKVVTAQEMFSCVKEYYKDSDIVVFAAAVSDYRCSDVCKNKIKKKGEKFTVELVINPDIAKEMGKKKDNKIHIGFNAETEDLIKNAETKLREKNFDMIVSNDITMDGAGFGTDTNIVKIIGKDGTVADLPKMSKLEVSHRILDEAVKLMNTEHFYD